MFFKFEVNPEPEVKIILGVVGSDRLLYWSVSDVTKYLKRPEDYMKGFASLVDVVGGQVEGIPDELLGMAFVENHRLLEALKDMPGTLALGLYTLLKDKNVMVYSVDDNEAKTADPEQAPVLRISWGADPDAKAFREWLRIFTRWIMAIFHEKSLGQLNDDDEISIASTEPPLLKRKAGMELFFDDFPPTKILVFSEDEIRRYKYDTSL